MPFKKDESIDRRKFLKGLAAVGATIAAGGAAGGLVPQPAEAAPEGIPAKWDKEVDVVIVGTGHAGLAAAIIAADAGAKVVILEKMKKEQEGGNSKVSGNMWWTPTDLPAGACSTSSALCYGLTPKDASRPWPKRCRSSTTGSTTLGIKTNPLGIFQPEHPATPRLASCAPGAMAEVANGTLWTPLRRTGRPSGTSKSCTKRRPRR